ncbi:MAG: bactofilin family protein [Arenicella sp.]
MLKKSSNTTPVKSSVDSVDTLIGANTVLQGDLEFSGGLRVDGQITGNIKSVDGNAGTLVLSESAVIEGNIAVPHVVVNGHVNGNIVANERVELQTKAVVKGDVRYKAVEMALGASVNGALVCDAGSPAMGGSKSANGAASKVAPIKS